MKRILTTLSQKWPEYLLEILVLIIGIYGAFAVEAWNNDRQNTQKEELILIELNREFRENKKQLEKITQVHQSAYVATLRVIDRFPIDPEKEDLDSLGKDILATLTTYSFNPYMGTLNSLVSTSSFELISNRDLRSLLVSWKDIFLDYSEDEIRANQDIYNFAAPYFNKNFSFELDLNDPRFDKNILTSLEFENQIKWRSDLLRSILNNDEQELQVLTQHIDQIIELSK